jgi:anaerobic selenocysteine-containing dehydrogenase
MVPEDILDRNERVIPTVCCSHCGGACVLKVHVKDGVVTRVETDDGDEPQYRACLRGRATGRSVCSDRSCFLQAVRKRAKVSSNESPGMRLWIT